MKKVLITGITGRSGKIFGKLLMQNGDWNVIALIRDKQKFKKIFGEQKGLSYEICDVQDEQEIKKILVREKVDTIFHISGIKYSIGIVNAAIEARHVKRIVLVHTTGIYSKYKAASAEYLVSEKKIDDLIKNEEIEITILRPTMIYGTLEDSNISKFIKMVDKIRFFPLVKGGKYELQPVNYEDLGKAYYQVLLNKENTRNRNYILSGGSVIYLKDILEHISEFLGKKTFFFSVPFWFAYSGAWGLYIASLGKCDYRERVQRLIEPRAYGHEDAKKDFNYSPMDFLEGLEKEVDEYKKSKKR